MKSGARNKGQAEIQVSFWGYILPTLPDTDKGIGQVESHPWVITIIPTIQWDTESEQLNNSLKVIDSKMWNQALKIHV